MFPHRYFAARYFAPRYWEPAVVPSPPSSGGGGPGSVTIDRRSREPIDPWNDEEAALATVLLDL